MKTDNWLSLDELTEQGIQFHGRVRVSRRASLYCNYLSLQDGCRIDDYAVLTGYVTLGPRVHIPPFCGLYGAEQIILGPYTTLAPGCLLFSASDDYKGLHLVGGAVPEDLRGPDRGSVITNAHVLLGAHSLVLPGTMIPEGASFGAYSLIKQDSPMLPWHVHAGIPAYVRERRSRAMLEKQKQLEGRE